MDVLHTTAGDFRLDRYPAGQPANLRAWDAADEYLLRRLDEDPPTTGTRILLVNDAFGALGTALHPLAPVSWSDSHLARLALAQNLAANGLAPGAVPFQPADGPPGSEFDLVLVKLPRSLAWLEDLLLRLRPCLAPAARVWLGGMIKHTPKRAYELMADIIGPAPTSLGWKKARLCEAVLDDAQAHPPGLAAASWQVDTFDLALTQQANVFSRDKLDWGTHLLLQYLPRVSNEGRVVDAGCGAGVLALAYARQHPRAHVLGVDESYQAVASARVNAAANGLADRTEFQVGDGLTEVAPDSLDLVLCNPPFHEGQVTGDQVAVRLFQQAYTALKTGGELRVVGNRHLGYHQRLVELFSRCRQVAVNQRFEVFSAHKAPHSG